jgi:hypothetical protein
VFQLFGQAPWPAGTLVIDRRAAAHGVARLPICHYVTLRILPDIRSPFFRILR